MLGKALHEVHLTYIMLTMFLFLVTVLTFIEDKIDGFYYNNGKDRSTYGTIKSLE